MENSVRNTDLESPFGIYSPYGEFTLDHSDFATYDEISEHIIDIGASWVQEVSVSKGINSIPDQINVYTRIGREGGMKPQLINDPNVIKRYKDELIQTVTNKKDRIKYWEVDTEPDGLGGWGNNPDGYVELLKMTCDVVRNICPDCKVMFGGLSGGQEILDYQGLSFLERVLDLGANRYFDGLEFKRHHNSSNNYLLLKDHYQRIGKLLSKHGVDIQTIPIFLETSMYDGDPSYPEPHPLARDLPKQSEIDQATGLLKTYIYGIALGIKIIFWNLIYERSDYEPGHAKPFPQNPFNHYGLIHNPTNNDGLSHKKLAYYSYKKMVEVLEGCDWDQTKIIQEEDNIFLIRFIKQNKPIYVAWWDYFQHSEYKTGDKQIINIVNSGKDFLTVTEAIPKYKSGAEVNNWSFAFKSENLIVKKGQVSISIGEIPIYIE